MIVHSNLSNKSKNAGGNIGGGEQKRGGQNHLFLKVRGTCYIYELESCNYNVRCVQINELKQDATFLGLDF